MLYFASISQPGREVQQLEALCTAEDLSKILRTSKAHIYYLTRSGAIPVIKVGRYYRFSMEEVLSKLSEEVR